MSMNPIGGPSGIPDNNQAISGKKQAGQPQSAQAPAAQAPIVDTKSVNAPKAADLAPVIAKFSQPIPAASSTGAASKTISTVDPQKEIARKVLQEIKKRDPQRWNDGLMNTR